MQARDTGEPSDDPLLKWVHWVDQAIEAAHERGDFDDLPGHGKPVEIEDHVYAGDRALGFHVLNNAGVKPLWMELDKEIQARRTTMQTLLDRLHDQTPAAETGPVPRRLESKVGWLRRLTHPRWQAEDVPRPQAGGGDTARLRARQDYLRLAAELDEKIRLYNHSLPSELRHLERMRLSVAQAAQTFDDAWSRAGDITGS